jgi:hypothetical protein
MRLLVLIEDNSVRDTLPVSDRTYLDAEKRLADYWRARTGLEWSDFDIFDPTKTRPKGVSVRYPYEEIDLDAKGNLSKTRGLIGDVVASGFPLSRREFYMAVGFAFLLTDLPYEMFYKVGWYENAQERGYGRKS